METYSPSKTVARNLGEEVLLDRPWYNKTRKENEITSKTDWRKIEKNSPAKSQYTLRDHMVEPEPVYRAIRILISS